ncbi:PAS domain S-box-containing protein [Daejeonella rubra]|uniref:histidine kinase n=1 Tax=Daejeonella rubra TaxID=990371 RepID=A0A1G9UP77_9SPHI|nr:histidine kinase N-terminal 7TM domain-containing protein [Daejeonella rubra]SDM61729.1 PAS domain S-box-containing protein [Daejeonella rubra]
MTFSLNTFSIILILCGLVTLYMCIRIFRRYEVVVRWFGFMVLGIGIWALSYGFELSSTSLEQMLFWINIEYLGISFMPAFWLLFIVKFTGRDKWLNTRNFIWIIIIPMITLLMVWTNHFHHLHYKSVSVDNSGPFPLLSIETGPWYIVHTLYFYILLAWGVLLLLYKYRKSDPVFKRQNLIILLAAFIPWFANLAYLFGFRPMGHIDSTPFAFVLTVLMLSIGLVRFRLLDIIPIAREKVLEAMKEGLIVTDNLDRIIDLNREIKKILSISGENLIGKNIDSVLPNQPELFGYIGGRKDGRIKIEIQRNGYPIFLEVSITALFEDENSFNGLIILTRDITSQVEIENQVRLQSEQLIAMNKLKDRLFSIIAHDLRGPLNNLNEVIKMLNAGMITEDEFKSFIPNLSKNIGYTTGLLENLLFWSRSQLQGEIIKPVYFNVKGIADNIIALFENVIKEKDIITENQLDPNALVYADMDMIQLIVRNLVSNAVKFSKHGGSIKITSYLDGNDSVICFCDSGVGISQENQKKLFELETFTTRGTDNEEGTGLGLLLCKDFIEKNGGRIWVESEIGEGSKFCVQIPNSPVNKAVQAN